MDEHTVILILQADIIHRYNIWRIVQCMLHSQIAHSWSISTYQFAVVHCFHCHWISDLYISMSNKRVAESQLVKEDVENAEGDGGVGTHENNKSTWDRAPAEVLEKRRCTGVFFYMQRIV